MDEELISRIVNLKLDVAGKLINRMPEKMSLELRDMGRIILKCVNENVQEMKEHPSVKSKSSDQLSHVPIE
jgi:hypothetical protein